MNEDRQPIILEVLGEPAEPVDLRRRPIVEMLVQSFADTCLEAFSAALGDERSLDEVVGTISERAEAYNEVFLGFSGLSAVAPNGWNTPAQLGQYLCRQLGLDGPPDQSVQALLIRFATQIMHGLRRREGDWPSHVRNLIADAIDLLLGVTPMRTEALDG